MADKGKSKSVRVAIYVDGFNLYFGLREKNWRKYYWLDIEKFASMLAEPRKLVAAKYFTARVSRPAQKVQRQQAYLQAITTHTPNVQIIEGKYQTTRFDCFGCSRSILRNEEKMTDVNIATQLVNDAWKDLFDLAIVVSGDSDLVPPIVTVNAEFPEKKVIVAYPPERRAAQIEQVTTVFRLSNKYFRDAQLPDEIEKPDGTKIVRPTSWN